MLRPGDEDEGLDEFLSLWSATTADSLHQVLVLQPFARRSSDASEPLALLRKHHQDEPGTSVATATLLLTDRRWRGGQGHLVRHIAESGVLTDEQLTALAYAFLAADRCISWPVPDEWFEGGTEIVIGPAPREDDQDEADDHEPAVGSGPAVAAREVGPPLRRWAAAHVLAREPTAWARVLATAQDLDARHGGAVLSGVFDTIDALPGDVQGLIVDRGSRWPHRAVRRAALELVLARDGVEAAVRLGEVDRDRSIRDWAATLGLPTPGPVDQETLF